MAILRGHHKTGLVLGVISVNFLVFFLKVNVQNGNTFVGAKISNIL